MPLTNPKYARQPPMGGFTAAPADATQYMFVPRDLGAEMAGSEVGTSTFTTEPAEAVGNAFRASMSASIPGEQSVIPPIPADEALPAGMSSQDIARAFAPLMNEIQGQGAPKPHMVSAPTPALATFLSVLAGSLGAQLAKDPRIEENIIQTLNEHEQRRQAIEDQNYANDLLFNQQKASRRLAAMGQQLEVELSEAQKAGDANRMMAANKNLENLRGFIQGRTEMIRGSEARKTARVAASLEEGTTAEEVKALEPKDYAARRGELLTSKELPEDKGMLWWKTHPRGDALAQLDKEALHSGNEKTVAAAKRNIQQAVLRKLGLTMKSKFDRRDSIAIRDALRELYDLAPEEVDF